MAACIDDRVESEYLIIGSGVAGLSAAIKLSEAGRKAVLITKSELTDSNTEYAQGGVTAVEPDRVASGEDKYELLDEDTLAAGDGLSLPHIVERFTRTSFDVIKFFEQNGIEFSTKPDGSYVRHQEGGHSRPRILCVGDYTGKAIEDGLAERVRNDPNITVYENHTAINLATRNRFSGIWSPRDRCLGAYVLERETGKVRVFQANKTFLATGGAGRAFRFTSNPENATGDGIDMAYWIGARISNMEFFQFHPTVFYDAELKPSERMDLITEALRGETMGGILTLTNDSIVDFVKEYYADGSHATRDKVSRAIFDKMMSRGLKHVWLNVTPEVTGKTPEFIREHYPKIYERCLQKNIDITKQAIPVRPAAHYTCGGVVVNEFGMTDIDGLYAIGEVACTGLMGANRLASNSLPEGALYGMLAVAHALATSDLYANDRIKIPSWQGPEHKKADTSATNEFWDKTREYMMDLCGIVRTEEGLKDAKEKIETLKGAADIFYKGYYPNHEIIELRNIITVAHLIIESALKRRYESRGGHFMKDFPDRNDAEYGGPSIVHRGKSEPLVNIIKFVA